MRDAVLQGGGVASRDDALQGTAVSHERAVSCRRKTALQRERHPVGCLSRYAELSAKRSYLPCHCGARFSTKAAGPSMPSAVFSRKR